MLLIRLIFPYLLKSCEDWPSIIEVSIIHFHVSITTGFFFTLLIKKSIVRLPETICLFFKDKNLLKCSLFKDSLVSQSVILFVSVLSHPKKYHVLHNKHLILLSSVPFFSFSKKGEKFSLST